MRDLREFAQAGCVDLLDCRAHLLRAERVVASVQRVDAQVRHRDGMRCRETAGLELCDLEHRSRVVDRAAQLERDGLEQVRQRSPWATALACFPDDASHVGCLPDAGQARHHPDDRRCSGNVDRTVGERSDVVGLLGSVEPAFDVGRTVAEQRMPGRSQAEQRIRADIGRIEPVQPPADRCDLSARDR